ncbi:hypothetical protein B0H19DRAFT_1075076 [Mycena capillaripes]|nr:hypothetical protein B0H19DRAFT_1075076 [Mycena capillaripes]
MARSSSSQPKPQASSNTTCEQCGASVKRPTDLPRHMLLHATNKEEFMFTCPVENSVRATFFANSLELISLPTSTRVKPYECPEYFPDGRKCMFETSDPSSLHRHRKRKHGYKPRSTTSSGPVASSSGSREKSVESSGSFESEESFGLRPETSDANQGSAGPSTDNISSYAIYGPYLTSNKVSGYHYASPYYSPLDLKIPDWIGLPVPFQSLDCSSDYGNILTSSTGFSTSTSTSDVTVLQWPESYFDGLGAYYCHWSYNPGPQAYPDSSLSSPLSSPISYSSRLHFQHEFATFSLDAFCSSRQSGYPHEPEYLELPPDLFPAHSITEPRATPERQ